MTTFGPQQGPPPLLCLFCKMAIPHQHADGYPPMLPCWSCWVGLCEACDPTTYWCACLDLACALRWGKT